MRVRSVAIKVALAKAVQRCTGGHKNMDLRNGDLHYARYQCVLLQITVRAVALRYDYSSVRCMYYLHLGSVFDDVLDRGFRIINSTMALQRVPHVKQVVSVKRPSKTSNWLFPDKKRRAVANATYLYSNTQFHLRLPDLVFIARSCFCG